MAEAESLVDQGDLAQAFQRLDEAYRLANDVSLKEMIDQQRDQVAVDLADQQRFEREQQARALMW